CRPRHAAAQRGPLSSTRPADCGESRTASPVWLRFALRAAGFAAFAGFLGLGRRPAAARLRLAAPEVLLQGRLEPPFPRFAPPGLGGFGHGRTRTTGGPVLQRAPRCPPLNPANYTMIPGDAAACAPTPLVASTRGSGGSPRRRGSCFQRCRSSVV